MRKRCSKCLQELTLDRFYKSNQTPDRLNSRCAPCQTTAVRECMERKDKAGIPRITKAQKAATLARRKNYYQKDPQKYRDRATAYARENPEKVRSSARLTRHKRSDQMRAYFANYYIENKDRIRANVTARVQALGSAMLPIYAAQTMKRYAGKVKATPAWASQKAIRLVYQEAVAVTLKTGVRHEVDHIVPIMSKKVCGLHVEHNLQILEKIANIRKGNRHWPDMP